MKKLSFLVAFLAIVFAVGSAFTTKTQKVLETGYFEVIGDIPWNASFDDSDFETSGAEVSPSAFGCLYTNPTGLICAKYFTDRDDLNPGDPGTVLFKDEQE